MLAFILARPFVGLSILMRVSTGPLFIVLFGLLSCLLSDSLSTRGNLFVCCHCPMSWSLSKSNMSGMEYLEYRCTACDYYLQPEIAPDADANTRAAIMDYTEERKKEHERVCDPSRIVFSLVDPGTFPVMVFKD